MTGEPVWADPKAECAARAFAQEAEVGNSVVRARMWPAFALRNLESLYFTPGSSIGNLSPQRDGLRWIHSDEVLGAVRSEFNRVQWLVIPVIERENHGPRWRLVPRKPSCVIGRGAPLDILERWLRIV